jgi:hypothetical protein
MPGKGAKTHFGSVEWFRSVPALSIVSGPLGGKGVEDKAANLTAARKQQERRKRVLVKGMLLATCAFHLSLTF